MEPRYRVSVCSLALTLFFCIGLGLGAVFPPPAVPAPAVRRRDLTPVLRRRSQGERTQNAFPEGNGGKKKRKREGAPCSARGCSCCWSWRRHCLNVSVDAGAERCARPLQKRREEGYQAVWVRHAGFAAALRNWQAQSPLLWFTTALNICYTEIGKGVFGSAHPRGRVRITA